MKKLFILGAISAVFLLGAGCASQDISGGLEKNDNRKKVAIPTSSTTVSKVITAPLNTVITVAEGERLKITDTPIEFLFYEYYSSPPPDPCPPNTFCENWPWNRFTLKANNKDIVFANFMKPIILDDEYRLVARGTSTKALEFMVYRKGSCDGISDERKRVYCIEEALDFMGCTKMVDDYAKSTCMNDMMGNAEAVANTKIDFKDFCSYYYAHSQLCMDLINKSLAVTKGSSYCEKIVDERNTGLKDECIFKSGGDCSLIKDGFLKFKCENRSK